MRSGKVRAELPVKKATKSPKTVPAVAESSDDEAPESVGFAEAKESALAEIQSARDQIKSTQEAKKEARKRKLEKFKAQKEEKQKKELEKRQNELPLDILESLATSDKNERPNKIKKFDEDDDDFSNLDLDEDDSVGRGPRFKVISKKDLSNLTCHVPKDILNFRDKMLNNSRIKRESAEESMNRRKKMKQINPWKAKRALRNK